MKTTQEKVQVMLAYDQGKNCEYKQKHEKVWEKLFGTPEWDWTHFDYRIKQSSPLIIPWDAIKPEYKWAAKDADGQVYVYAEKPYLVLSMEWWEDCGGTGSWLGDHTIIQDPDNIDWKDSLVERPST